MGTLADLEQARARRQARARVAAEHAAWHPALRWLVAGDQLAHRRAAGGGTACGVVGPLQLADAAVSLCPDCYSQTGT